MLANENTPLLATCLVLLVGLVGASDGTRKQNSIDDPVKALESLEGYLRQREAYDHVDSALKASRRVLSSLHRWRFGRQLRVGARIFVYLNEFEICSPRALEYMGHVLSGRPGAEPNFLPAVGVTNGQRDPFDRLLENSLRRAASKCRTYLETWLKVSEERLDEATKAALYNQTLPREVIRRRSSTSLTDLLTDAALRAKPTMASQWEALDAEQVAKFYTNYIHENYIKPCETFLAATWSLMEATTRLGVSEQVGLAKWFVAPSPAFVDFLYRFHRCQMALVAPDRVINEVVRRFKNSIKLV